MSILEKYFHIELIVCVYITVWLVVREAADKVVKGEGKFEELIVCSQEIAASTTQLVVSSKVTSRFTNI